MDVEKFNALDRSRLVLIVSLLGDIRISRFPAIERCKDVKM